MDKLLKKFSNSLSNFKKTEETLRNKFPKVYYDKKFSNFTILSEENNPIRVHKVILYENSYFFDSYFQKEEVHRNLLSLNLSIKNYKNTFTILVQWK